jgi:hypothetical protein
MTNEDKEKLMKALGPRIWGTIIELQTHEAFTLNGHRDERRRTNLARNLPAKTMLDAILEIIS